ncbi:NADPH-dependent FMN reductase [Brevibacterium luteolum]|uniref:NAD(P)H-dependent oxidoreductase n=1 Tax=Brevibacterium luteolum TaxID=199591 RepID=A0A849AU25_9MICO|nr:NADPH-dependent FMN reductase [Brevibacterium luteolum]MBM7529135.1 FMN reductase [Brevibacterium luteolum]NNG80319.1 NAD(P)H-dependent oxidoreductase [Brevibacterium luteolum]
MKIVGLSGSTVGATTRTAMNYAMEALGRLDPEIETQLIDLADYDVQFSDGRDYIEYTGDTRTVAEALMSADAIIIGSPIFQASIPGALKNVFDLLPVSAFEDKVVGIIMTAGSPKHYLVAEHQLRPILTYMKAQVVQSYVFVEAKDVYRGEIISGDVTLRIDRLVEDTAQQTRVASQVRAEREAAYAF